MSRIKIHHARFKRAETKLGHWKLKNAVTNYFRVLEFFLVAITISQFFSRLYVIVFSPGFVFLLGNTIVIILVINSGKYSKQRRRKTTTTKTTPPPQKSRKAEILKTDYRKQGIRKKAGGDDDDDTIMESIFPTSSAQNVKIYQRSHSDRLIISRRAICEESCSDLRRVKTSGNLRGGGFSGCKEDAAGRKEFRFPEDHMSSDEFRQTIEDFIARQQRFVREEEFSVAG